MTMTTFLSKNNDDHPVLIIPNEDGAMLVIGLNQAQKHMTKRQMFEMGMRFLRASRPDNDQLSPSL